MSADRVILQVPMSRSLKKAAETASLDYGFSSLQEIIRVMLNKLAKKELTVTIQEKPAIKLSQKAIKRYNKLINDINQDKYITKTKNLDELFKLLKK